MDREFRFEQVTGNVTSDGDSIKAKIIKADRVIFISRVSQYRTSNEDGKRLYRSWKHHQLNDFVSRATQRSRSAQNGQEFRLKFTLNLTIFDKFTTVSECGRME